MDGKFLNNLKEDADIEDNSGEDSNGDNFTIDEKEQDQIIENDHQASFVAEIGDGYSFRNLIEFLKIGNNHGYFKFSEDKIVYEQSDCDDNTIIINYAEIISDNLQHYELLSKGDFYIGINLGDFRIHTKNIKRHDSIRLYKRPTDGYLYMQIIGNNLRTDTEDVSIIKPQMKNLLQIDYPKNYNGRKRANIQIKTSEFFKACNSLCSLKCDYIMIYGFPRGITFEALSPAGISMKTFTFGNKEDVNINESESESIKATTNRPKIKILYTTYNAPSIIKVSSGTIKSFTKFNNICKNGQVKFYFENKRLMRMSCNIGDFGFLDVYVRSLKINEPEESNRAEAK